MVQKILITYLLFFSVFLFPQCPSGSVSLSNQIDINNFINNYPNCSVISGDLNISGNAFDFSKLTFIKRIEGNLIIEYSKISDVSNFSNLEYVGGDLKIRATALKNLIGFSNLKTINGSLSIYENNFNGLETINGFENLETIKGDLQFYEISLKTITGFEKLIEINNNLIISSTPRLTQIPSFNSLKIIGGDLKITNDSASALENINSFNSLEIIGKGLSIGSHSLVSIEGFKNLKTVVGLLQISTFGISSPKLVSIPEFENLETIGSITISKTGLTKISGFNNLKNIGAYDPPAGWFIIYENNELTTISGFNTLNRIYGVVQIFANNKLQNIKGLNQLNRVGGSLYINNNLALTSLTGLESLMNVGELLTPSDTSIKITRNTSLSDCSSICNLLSMGGNKGLIEINENPSKCSNQNEVQQECIPDFDKDGILDDDDLDDDNDGILDAVENNGISNRDSDHDGFPDSRDLDSDNDGCNDTLEANFKDNDGDGYLGSPPYIVNSNGLVISATDGYTTPPDNNNDGLFDFQTPNILNAGKNGKLNICSNEKPVDLFNYLSENPDKGGTWTPNLSSGNGIFNPAIDPAGIYTYTISNGKCGNSSAQITVRIDLIKNAGDNGYLSICKSSNPVDLFNSLNGTPNTGGTWSPKLSSNNGIFDPKKDVSGNYKYTLTNGTCETKTAEVQVRVDIEPDAGDDRNLIICSNDIPVDLFYNLGGNPQRGGIWSPALLSKTGVFDPAKDSAGIYNYTVSNGICGNDTSTVNVIILKKPNAGINNNLLLCTTAAPIDLFQNLNGIPDIGGVWSPKLSSETSLFDPANDPAGIYTYTVSNGSCEKSTSEIKVDIDAVPNAGENTNITVCVKSDPFNLFESLKGSPQKGGTWNPNLFGGTNIFDPSVDTSTVYTYKVDNGVCGSSTAKVNISYIQTSPILDYKIESTYFMGNNKIVVDINLKTKFEYSLDGMFYQESNIFENLPGGEYTVFIREINGCGFYKHKVTIIDYPRFFTPNGDGHNDLWYLKGEINKEYSINIFDRYGKLLKKLTENDFSWDGTYNTKLLPSDDYWFEIIFNNGERKKGHFSLKR